MKRFCLLFIVFLLCITNQALANTVEAPTTVTFIYINGSNNLAYKNRLKFKVAFLENVKKMHPEIKTRFEKDPTIQKLFLQNGKYIINPEPITFYWGDKSLSVVETLDKDLKSASKYSPKIAHQARTLFAHCLHDAVWVQKPQNMSLVIKELHEIIMNETSKGNKVVLLGYSAGSFVTYQYYLNKSSSLNLKEVLAYFYGNNINDYLKNATDTHTCFDALIDGDIIKYNLELGKYEANKDLTTLTKNYTKLGSISDTACFKDDTVKGVIGFASPARLFYSDFTNPKTNISNLSKYMAKSIIENNVFYLTVNYSNDPFGFSNSENFTFKQLQDVLKNIDTDFNEKHGFIYNKSNNYVPRTFVTAHLAYWDTPKRFAKAIVKAFNEGYANFYNNSKNL